MTFYTRTDESEAIDHTAAFTAFLDDDTRARLRTTDTLRYWLQAAIREQHWTVQQLADEANRDHDTSTNVGAVITDRLKICATVPPPKTVKAKISKGVPFCTKECRENQGWVYDFTVEPPAQSRCACRGAA